MKNDFKKPEFCLAAMFLKADFRINNQNPVWYDDYSVATIIRILFGTTIIQLQQYNL